MRSALLPALSAGAFLLVGCVEPDDRPATWSYLHATVIAPACATATCHSELAVRAGLDLGDPDESYRLLLEGTGPTDGPFVFPGDDAQSPLVWVLDGDERTRMPPDAPLPAVDRELVRAWIRAGAPR